MMRKPHYMRRWFATDHLPPSLQELSSLFATLAADLDARLRDSPEKSVGMRKLLEAKDCFVRAQLETPSDE